ncbi:MAG TPA: hypothetical protein VFZ38_22035 [Vicinamibacterales bacterium]
MPPGRMLSGLAVAIAIVSAAAHPLAAPSLEEVLNRAASYVERFRRQLSEIVSEETYRQSLVRTPQGPGSVLTEQSRTLRSHLLLVRPANVERYVEFRDVFDVDGDPVRDRQDRVSALWRTGSAESSARLGAILEESARYNIGAIQRNINTPLMALMFLDAAHRKRFTFKHVDHPRPVFGAGQQANDTGVFRVSTEMWSIEFEERRGNTIIKRPNGGDLRSRGRFWIDPDTGAVLISELIVDGGGVRASVTVSYQSEPLMGFLVPVEMRESYERRGEAITGHAVYGKFRLLKQ